MKLLNYLIYKLSDDYAFKQVLICNNKYMDKNGVCFGLTVDWLRYSAANPTKDYVTDKYNLKYKVDVSFNWKDGLSLFHTMNSKNYYNRINYYQKKANLEFSKTDTKDLYETDSFAISDKAFMVLSDDNDESGHACAYKIEQKDSGYHYTYFDPNFGETHSNLFIDRNDAVKSLQNLLRYEIANYKILSDGAIDFSINPLFINDSEEFTEYLVQSWKSIKSQIESYGTYENSMNYREFPEGLFQNDYYIT